MINSLTNSLPAGDELLSVNGRVLAGYSVEEVSISDLYQPGKVNLCLCRPMRFWRPSTASRIERKEEDEEKRKRHETTMVEKG